MATRTPKTVKKVVNLMTNANPEFVSLVGHPANQTPFKAVKLDPNAVERIAQTEAQSELVRRSGIAEVEVHRFRFDKTTFKSEETVRSYLDARGWTDYSVNEDDKYFEVPNLGVEEFEGDLEEIPAQKGITMTVGKVKKSAEPTQARKEVSPGTQAPADTPKVPALEVVKKYDAWYAAWSNGKSLKDVMAEGYDGLPPGFWDIADAYVTAIRNNLISGDDNAIRSLGDEFNDVLMKLVSVFKHLTPEQVQKMTEKPTATPTVPATKDATTAPPANIPAGASTEKTPEQLAAEAAVAPGTATTITDATPPVVEVPEMNAKDGAIAEVVAKSVRDALSSTLADALKPLTVKVDSTAETLAQLASRMDAVEAGQSQTRKSVSAEEVTPPGVVPPAQNETPDPEKVARMARREKREREGMLGI